MSRAWPFNFQEVFVPAVEAGRKRQTIRAERKDRRRPQPGDTARCYERLRSKGARLLYAGTIFEVFSVDVIFVSGRVISNGVRLHSGEIDSFARLDGFTDAHEFFHWFQENHGPWFQGWCCRWRSSRGDLP